MHERFTDVARAAIQAAQDEATRMKRIYVGTESMLMALLHPDCPVCAMLALMGIDPAVVRAEIERVTVEETHERKPLTPHAKRVVEYALEEARELTSHGEVRTDALLLGLLRVEDSMATVVLNKCGVTLERARAAAVACMKAPVPG